MISNNQILIGLSILVISCIYLFYLNFTKNQESNFEKTLVKKLNLDNLENEKKIQKLEESVVRNTKSMEELINYIRKLNIGPETKTNVNLVDDTNINIIDKDLENMEPPLEEVVELDNNVLKEENILPEELNTEDLNDTEVETVFALIQAIETILVNKEQRVKKIIIENTTLLN